MNKENTNTYKIVFSVALLVLLLWLSIGVTVVAGNLGKNKETKSYQIVEYSKDNDFDFSFAISDISDSKVFLEEIIIYLNSYNENVKEKTKDGWLVYNVDFEKITHGVDIITVYYKRLATVTFNT